MRKLANVALRREPAIIRTLFFVAPFLTLLIPKTTVAAIILLFLCCAGFALARGADCGQVFWIHGTLALFGATALYLFINAFWSLDPERAFTAVAWFVAIVAMTFGACRALAMWPKRSLDMAVSAFLVAVCLGTGIILIEVLTERLLTLSLYNALPFTQPGSLKGFGVQNGEIVRIPPGELNQNIAIMLLMLWPVLLEFATRLEARMRWLCTGALVAAMVLATLLSEHESSKVGLALSVVVFAAARAWPSPTRKAVWLGWCLAFLLVIPLALAAYKAELHKADWLPFSAQARVTLWAYTAEQVPNAPILGIGASSTRKIDQAPENRQHEWKKKQRSEGFGWRAGSHAHNAFMQTWYELGAVGVILFLVTGSAVILSVGQLPVATQSYTLAQITAFLAIMAFGWGMWQAWLVALAGLAAVYLALAVSYDRVENVTEATAEP